MSSDHEAYSRYYLPRLRRWSRSSPATGDEEDDRIVTLALHSTGLTDADCVELAAALRINATLRYLVTSGNPGVSLSGLKLIAEALAGHPALEVWRMAGSGSSDDAAGPLCRDLTPSFELSTDDLGHVAESVEETVLWYSGHARPDMISEADAASGAFPLQQLESFYEALRNTVVTCPRLRRLLMPAPPPTKVQCSVIQKEFVLEDESTHFGNTASVSLKTDIVLRLRKLSRAAALLHRVTRIKGLLGSNAAPRWVAAVIAATDNSTALADASQSLNGASLRGVVVSQVAFQAALQVVVDALFECTTVKRLDFSGHGRCFGDESAATLSKLLHSPTLPLIDLALSDNDIGPRGLADLTNALQSSCNRTLLDMDLRGNRGTDASAKQLLQLVEKGSCAISHVDLTGNCIEPSLISHLLHSLALNSQPPRFREAMREVQSGSAIVQRVIFSQQGDQVKLNDVSCRLLMQAMRSNSVVTHIDLSSNNITDEGAIFLADIVAGNPAVKKVVLQFNRITDDGAAVLLAALPRNPSIELLDLKFQSPQPVSSVMLDKLTWLSSLNTHPIELKTKGLLILQNDPSLTAFRIAAYDGKRRLTNAGLELLAEMLTVNVTLNEICIANHPSSDLVQVGMWIPKLSTSIGSRITILDLSGNALDDAVGASIDENLLRGAVLSVDGGVCGSRLKELVLCRNAFTKDTAARFAASLRDVNATVIRVDLADNPKISANDAEAVTYAADLNRYDPGFKRTVLRVAANDPAIREVSLVQVEKTTALGTSHHFARRYDDLAARLLAQALEQNGCVTGVNLNGNSIGDAGASSLAEMLKCNSRLTSLHLMSNEITDVGLAALSRAVMENHSVRVLTFDGNRGIKDAALQRSVAMSLAQNASQQGAGDDSMASTAAIYNAALSTKRAKLTRAADQTRVVDKAILDDAMADFYAAEKRREVERRRMIDAGRDEHEARLLQAQQGQAREPAAGEAV